MDFLRMVSSFFALTSLAKLRFAGCLLLILVLVSSCASQEPAYRLVHANDADSFFVTDYNCHHDCKAQELRLIGIDAPEYSQEPWGKRALAYVKSQIKPDTKIYLENDMEKYDKYGRRLVFFYYINFADKQRVMLNQELLKLGYAQLFIFNSYQKYLDQFKDAELTARQTQLHIWNPDNGLEMSPSKYRKKNRRQQKHI